MPWPRKVPLAVVRADEMDEESIFEQTSNCLAFSQPSTQQQLLVWKRRPQTALVLKKLGDELHDHFALVCRLLLAQRLHVVVEPREFAKAQGEAGLDALTTYEPRTLPSLHEYVDFVVCLGGDGTILHASSLFPVCVPPVISFSLGSLGFLTNHRLEDAEADLAELIEGSRGVASGRPCQRVHVTLRMRLEATVSRANSSGSRRQGSVHEVLNEVVVDRGANPYLTKLECWDHGRLLTKVQADGVMLATPTGSTAYNVAAGGSMVHPSVPSILFTPICPHSLSFRPVVLPDYADLELRVPCDARSSAWVSFDGKDRQELQPGDTVRVRMSTNPVPTISRGDQTTDWFSSLQRCFGWNNRVDQKPNEEAPSGRSTGEEPPS